MRERVVFRRSAIDDGVGCRTARGMDSQSLDEDEVEVLKLCRQEKGKKEPLDLNQAIRTIAGWGGFIGRKGDGDPGAMTLWRGYQVLKMMVLKMMVAGWKLCKKYR